MEAALYATSWVAAALFVSGEAAKRGSLTGAPEPRWAWPLWFAGALLCIVHTVAVLDVRYAWDHDAAVRATGAQTNAVYGLDWGGGIYVNYLFIAAWFGEAVWWRLDRLGYFAQPRAMRMALRSFYLVVLLNATVIFAAPIRRAFGVALIAALLIVWGTTPLSARRQTTDD